MERSGRAMFTAASLPLLLLLLLLLLLDGGSGSPRPPTTSLVSRDARKAEAAAGKSSGQGKHAKRKQRERGRRCEAEGCSRFASYGEIGTRKARFCASHRPEGFVDVKNRRCKHEGCPKLPTYGRPPGFIPPDQLAEAYGQHPGSGNEVPYSRLGVDDAQPGSKQDPAPRKGGAIETLAGVEFGGGPGSRTRKLPQLEKASRPEYCKEHCPLGYVRTKKGGRRHHKLCIVQGCNLAATFGDPETRVASYCGEHRDSICNEDVRHGRCAVRACRKQPSYGPTPTRPVVCREHRYTQYGGGMHLSCKYTPQSTTRGFGVEPGAPGSPRAVVGENDWIHNEQLWGELQLAAHWDVEAAHTGPLCQGPNSITNFVWLHDQTAWPYSTSWCKEHDAAAVVPGVASGPDRGP